MENPLAEMQIDDLHKAYLKADEELCIAEKRKRETWDEIMRRDENEK